jgi:tetratricopeptide (TPR) repeat protein
MSIEALKEQARRHEQKDQWKKALGLYMRAIERMSADDPDIALYNRAGDLNTRVGNDNQAVECYNRAIDLYIEAELPNNAIAICKKVIRNFPSRPRVFLRMGQVRASQGYIADARTNFLTYAERVQAQGDTDEALRALIEFADIATDDHEIRMLVGAQLEQLERVDEAVAQLVSAHQILNTQGMADEASGVEAKIRELDPNATISAPEAAADVGVAADVDDGDLQLTTFGDEAGLESDFGTDFGAVDLPESKEVDEEPAAVEADLDGAMAELEDAMAVFEDAEEDAEEDDAVEAVEAGDLEEAMAELEGATAMFETPSDEMEIEVTGSGYLDEADEEEPEELPILGVADEADEEVAVAAGESDLGVDDLPGASDAMETAMEEAVADEPTAVEEEETPAAAEEEAPAPPPAGGEGGEYVDLGSMILGTPPKEKSTRFVVEYEEPTGDEEADFSRMLAQFKEKVSENVDADDVTSHHDLGTAYKEMGLLDEAIHQYQQALKASDTHLPTYEMLGQTFIEKGEHAAAVNSLDRALEAEHEIEDELIGIYYYLGLAHEALGNTEEAIGYFDRVFALDINFADVTERLRALRD